MAVAPPAGQLRRRLPGSGDIDGGPTTIALDAGSDGVILAPCRSAARLTRRRRLRPRRDRRQPAARPDAVADGRPDRRDRSQPGGARGVLVATSRPARLPACPPSAPRVERATCCPPSAATWSTPGGGSPSELAVATATGRSRRRCSSRRRSSSAGSARSPTSSRRSSSGSLRGTEEAEAWALRPEPTAGIVRAYVQHGMQTWPQPVKLTTIGPMFRYDRPQAGRYRQFWQFDVEAIGDPGPAVDAEIIELGARFYREAGLDDVEVHLNSIGDATCRPALPRGARRVLPRPCRRAARRSSASGSSATRCASSTRRTRRWPRSTPARRGSSTSCATPCARALRGVRAHLDALGVGVPARARPRPGPRLLHPDRLRVLSPRQRGPAVGARRRRPLRRARRAAGRAADAGDRLRDRPRSGRCSRSSDTGARRRRVERGRSRSSSAPTRRRPSERLARRDGAAGGRPRGPGRSSASASSVASSRRPPATARTSR